MIILAFACLTICACTVDAELKVTLHASSVPEHVNLNSKFLMYDVNPVEGFNLRRDVFIRMANLVRKLNEVEAWTLILPPFVQMSHWKSKVENQERVAWGTFFEISNISILVPVIELDDYVDLVRRNNIDHVYYIQSDMSVFEDGEVTNVEPNLYAVAECQSEHEADQYGFQPSLADHELVGGYEQLGFEHIDGRFWNHPRLFAHKLDCLSVFASASSLVPFLTSISDSSVLLDRAERLIHGPLGEYSPEYWTVRRSMVFNRTLIDAALRYSKRHLSNEAKDMDEFYTALYSHYRKEWWNYRLDALTNDSGILNGKGSLLGGPYVALHYRKAGGYDRMHQGHVPNVNEAARQVRLAIDNLRREGVTINAVYVSSDASRDEIQMFKRELYNANVRVASLLSDAVHPDRVLASYADGGIAIIEQIIAAHAAYFIGTAYSTFTYRIQEERIIAGFDADSTYNVLCCNAYCRHDLPADEFETRSGMRCARVSKWKVLEEPGVAEQLSSIMAQRIAAQKPLKRGLFNTNADADLHEQEQREMHRRQELLRHTEL